MRSIILACACSSVVSGCATDPPPAFGLVGVVDDQFEQGSTIGLWKVTDPSAYTYKFGDGQATPTEFGISFRIDPPPAQAIDGDGVGVAFIGLLPGIATVVEGEVEPANLRLIGMSTESAVIFRSPQSNGPAWTDRFPEGYACGVCDRSAQPNTFVPADCTFVTIERIFDNPCAY